jgi:hypothetical protein
MADDRADGGTAIFTEVIISASEGGQMPIHYFFLPRNIL